MNSPMPVPRISPSIASSTAIGTSTGVYVAASTGAEATPPICASDEMPHSYRSKRNVRAASASSAM